MCVHNLDRRSLDSSKAADLSLALTVKTFDRYSNPTFSDASSLTVKINSEPEIPLVPPDYSAVYEIARDSSTDLEISFLLDGEHIADSPVTVTVEPDTALETTITIAASVGSCLLLAILAGTLFFKRKQRFAQEELARVEHQRSQGQAKFIQQSAKLLQEQHLHEEDKKMLVEEQHQHEEDKKKADEEIQKLDTEKQKLQNTLNKKRCVASATHRYDTPPLTARAGTTRRRSRSWQPP
jgi:hypothetical protein